MKKTYKEQEEEKKELNLERKKLKKQLKKIEFEIAKNERPQNQKLLTRIRNNRSI